MWRLITEKIATKEEINKKWHWDDVMKANAVLDFQKEVERKISE